MRKFLMFWRAWVPAPRCTKRAADHHSYSARAGPILATPSARPQRRHQNTNARSKAACDAFSRRHESLLRSLTRLSNSWKIRYGETFIMSLHPPILHGTHSEKVGT